ncbi:MAG TPA: hypothetical protein EYN67_18295 [Flavobacteriales bacterium]|nr:hypothetical protein [Flavobacteriales bacterium]
MALRTKIHGNDRLLILARAAYQLLKKQDESSYVLNLLGESTVWDGVECDGYCLMEELKSQLIDEHEIDPDFTEEAEG